MKLKQKQPINLCASTKQAPVQSLELVSLRVLPQSQELLVVQHDQVLRKYTISTAKNGLGEEKNSFKTPRGQHVIRAKIGSDCPENAVFVRRRFTGEICTPELYQSFPTKDWILTRILWLSGCEPGFNRLGNVDTMQRYIYIHGTPDARQIGLPSSRGCIRMRNNDIIELFDLVTCGVKVNIEKL